MVCLVLYHGTIIHQLNPLKKQVLQWCCWHRLGQMLVTRIINGVNKVRVLFTWDYCTAIQTNLWYKWYDHRIAWWWWCHMEVNRITSVIWRCPKTKHRRRRGSEWTYTTTAAVRERHLLLCLVYSALSLLVCAVCLTHQHHHHQWQTSFTTEQHTHQPICLNISSYQTDVQKGADRHIPYIYTALQGATVSQTKIYWESMGRGGWGQEVERVSHMTTDSARACQYCCTQHSSN